MPCAAERLGCYQTQAVQPSRCTDGQALAGGRQYHSHRDCNTHTAESYKQQTLRCPGAGQGRALLDAGGDLTSTLINSTLWLEADVLSLTGYAMRTLPTSITDARTSVNGETVTAACSWACVSLYVVGEAPHTQVASFAS